ncbi:MAG TPA: AMP-binding protein [Rhodanobacter sp.]|nr:AMP-binding protein [Rhodanobacter sp.]
MQPYSLTIDKFLEHAAKWWGRREVVSVQAGIEHHISYAALRDRSNSLSGALRSLGLRLGDRVGTLGWNTQNHLEMYYATMGAGFVCHTLNPRYTVEHLAAIINEAEDRALAVTSSLATLLDELLPLCPTIEQVVIMDGALPDGFVAKEWTAKLWFLDTLLDQRGVAVAWGDFDEEAPAGLCYTSGTTGPPKGVLYTHRANYLHTLRVLQADALALTDRDVVLAAVPMFHANGWGLPFAVPAVGAKLVLPGRDGDGVSLAALLREEKVTVAVGVHTLWLGVIDHLDAVGGELPELERILIGGSRCPETLIRRMEERLGVRVQTSWGMTELCPTGTIASPATPSPGNQTSGRPCLGIDLKLTDADGKVLPRQRGVTGHLKVKGASVIDRYYKTDVDVLDDEGYFDTGDLASIDDEGNLTIRGRSKDLIKSGGEWINPSEIEDIVGHHPAVSLVAVIGRTDAKWGERPVLVVEPRAGATLEAEEVLACLKGKVADWWIPNQVELVSAMPLAATGKIDKLQLRVTFGETDVDGECTDC